MQELLQARLLMRYSCILQAEVGTAVYTGDTAQQSCTVKYDDFRCLSSWDTDGCVKAICAGMSYK